LCSAAATAVMLPRSANSRRTASWATSIKEAYIQKSEQFDGPTVSGRARWIHDTS
jgi:hypothetical protein